MTTTKTITLHTKLNSGIYADCGGGEDVVHGEWTLGPRNLLKAVDALNERCRQARESYGDIGAGWSWLQVGADVLDLTHRGPFTQVPDAEDTKITGETRTQWAQYVLAALTKADLQAHATRPQGL